MDFVILEFCIAISALSDKSIYFVTFAGIETAVNAKIAVKFVLKRLDSELRVTKNNIKLIVSHWSCFGKQFEVNSITHRYDQSSFIGSLSLFYTTLTVSCHCHSWFGFYDENYMGVAIDIVMEVVGAFGIVFEKNFCLKYFSVLVFLYCFFEVLFLAAVVLQAISFKNM